ncbi:unnamed protein product [Sphagnum jensenii]|uniref:Protein kinase domain-containing protein n=1 Tax=Sphagnum jensenii TaxID=128206 RepID=A0ABP0XAB4_9BRYO
MSSSGEGTWTGEMTAETGTYRWMSPEVFEHKLYDHKVDVYSFGIMMWEVLTGGVPYDGFTPLQAAIGVVQQGVRPEIPPFVPEKLSLLAQQCWHQDPKQGPEFSEVLAVLEEMVMVQMTNRRFMFGGRKTRKTLLHE